MPVPDTSALLFCVMDRRRLTLALAVFRFRQMKVLEDTYGEK